MYEQAPGKRGVHAGAGCLAGPVASGGPTLEQSVPEGLHPMERTHTGAFPEGLYPVGRAYTGTEEKCEKEGAIERNQWALTVSLPPAFAVFIHWGAKGTEATSGNNKERGERSLEWSEVELGKKR